MVTTPSTAEIQMDRLVLKHLASPAEQEQEVHFRENGIHFTLTLILETPQVRQMGGPLGYVSLEYYDGQVRESEEFNPAPEQLRKLERWLEELIWSAH